MRVTLAESMCDPEHYVPLAQAADQAGYHGLTIPDSICYPEISDSKYPYTPDGNREFLDGKPFIEPMILTAHLAAATERLHFATFVVKLPVRNPVMMAKQAMSLAVMSQNRFTFGVGISPWPEDFAVTGTPWAGRGKRMDEMIEILRGYSPQQLSELMGISDKLAGLNAARYAEWQTPFSMEQTSARETADSTTWAIRGWR